MPTLKVLITTDVEIWPDGWDRMGPEDFKASYRKYILGDTPRGQYGLPFQLRLLDEHGLHGVFMVETLFTHGYGIEPLRDIVGLIQERGQEVQLHLHPEWIDKFDTPILPRLRGYYMHQYTDEEQRTLLRMGLNSLREAGVDNVSAFRAGSYGAGHSTLEALAAVGLRYDTSHNQVYQGDACLIDNPPHLSQPAKIGGVWELPITCFREPSGRIRPLQIHACSLAEIQRTLIHAREQGWHNVVIVLHGSELLGESKRRVDPIAVRRYEGMCRFLADHAEDFETCGFDHPELLPGTPAHPPYATLPLHLGIARRAEQTIRRIWA
ncbi:hypothetical protein B1C78_07750 [Thioalkalivibrio denitrificans]|uniref:Polysaccharide deacetylase n=1 Tax=Thioalkalivibrio denitrificans TaxID=108003 RepID=A0A1V3NJG5_9GAMM|nr:hypothetical protein [Thioalkalivibrio denitrificans]OOG24896.1 hypothetical protein B1C78_07750 [Thioalkalivibrio denitrificans]